MRDTTSLANKLLLTGLLVLIGTGTVACRGLSNEALVEALKTGVSINPPDVPVQSSGDDMTAMERLAQETTHEASTDSKALRVAGKTLLFSRPAQSVKQLNLGIHSSSAKVDIETVDEPTISVEYRLVSRKENEQSNLEDIELESDQADDLLAVTLSNLPPCGITYVNRILVQLNGVCATDVIVTIPAEAEIAIYTTDFYDELEDVRSDSILHDLVWPSQVPDSVQALANVLSSDIDEARPRSLLIKRFVAAGRAEGITATDCVVIADAVEESWVKRRAVQLLASSLKATYEDQNIPMDELQPVLESMDEGDRQKALDALT